MSTALFEEVIFGPIHSRRLGLSLGVNLPPQHAKICNFDCIYCECGSNSERVGLSSERRFATRGRVSELLEAKLREMTTEGALPDVITFAGNGEPTMHPDFEAIIDDTIKLRDSLSPNSKISVLSNATRLSVPSVQRALLRVDNNILKLDSALQTTAEAMNRPNSVYSVESVIDGMRQFEGRCIVQTMLLRGEVEGQKINNTAEEEVEAYIEAIKKIAPSSVMLYSIDRDTPCGGLQRVSKEDMESIAERLRSEGYTVSVS
ncbi:MAG: radical SAM protein [Rikenellaceae bacterium]